MHVCVYIFLYYTVLFKSLKFDTFNLLKVTVKTFGMLQKKSVSNMFCCFELWSHQRILKKGKNHGFHKNIKQKKKFNMVLEHQISILEWFLKNHVTLMIRVMMLKMQLQEEITYSNIFKWKSSDLVVTIFPISQFYSFFIFLFYQVNAALESLRAFFQKHIKIVLTPKY